MARIGEWISNVIGLTVSEPAADALSEAPEVGSGMNGDTRFKLGDLPESCMAAILRLTSPKDVGRLACVCRTFRSAADSDFVWESMLPSRYMDVLDEASNPPPKNSLKKTIYDYLSNRVLLENGTQQVWLDRATGGLCRSIGARGLDICWSQDARYWDWQTLPGSRFAEVAFLKSVCWFDVKGQLECFLPPGRYTLSWSLFLTGRENGRRRPGAGIPERVSTQHSYGWRHPVKFSFETTAGDRVDMEFPLLLDGEELADRPLPGGGRRRFFRSPNDAWLHEIGIPEQIGTVGMDEPGGVSEDRRIRGSKSSNDTWMEEIEVGEFVVENEDSKIGIQFSIMEINGQWKHGLYLDGMVIRPSQVRI